MNATLTIKKDKLANMKKLLFFLSILFLISCNGNINESKAEKTRKTVLVEKAKKETLARLKTPSTAIFIDSLASVSKMKDTEAYQVRISVDAENSFGAKLRNRYFIIYDDMGGDSLDPDNYQLNMFID